MAEKGEGSYSPKDIANEKQEASKEVKNWLGDKKEIASIKDKNLKVFVESLSRINPDVLGEKAVPFLLNSYGTLQNEASFKNIDPEEADQYMASIYSKIEELQRGGKREDKGPSLDMKNLLDMLEKQALTDAKKTEILLKTFKKLSPKEERERWVDVEYRQGLTTRFTPTQEPNFYINLPEDERRLFDARWQLARGAFFKKTVIAFPEKMVENQDLGMLTGEQMELLYGIPGVKSALEWYAKMITSKKEVDIGDKKKELLNCKNEAEFDKMRRGMRKEIFKNKDGSSKEVKISEDEGKEADAIAWNLIWCSNLIESMDSRYSSNKFRHDKMPFSLYSDDLRAVFHPQEYFEENCIKGRIWGAFGTWGTYQIERIKNKLTSKREKTKSFYPKKIEDIICRGTSNPREFWKVNRIEEKKEIEIFFPECHPTTAFKSFWELERQPKEKGDRLGPKENLLECLKKGTPIRWDEVESGFWGAYLPKVNRATKLFSYFKDPETRIGSNRRVTKDWSDELLVTFNKIKLEKILDERRFHNLKFWLAHAGTGGVMEIKNTTPTLRLPTEERFVFISALRHRNVRFLSKKEKFKLRP